MSACQVASPSLRRPCEVAVAQAVCAMPCRNHSGAQRVAALHQGGFALGGGGLGCCVPWRGDGVVVRSVRACACMFMCSVCVCISFIVVFREETSGGCVEVPAAWVRMFVQCAANAMLPVQVLLPWLARCRHCLCSRLCKVDV